MADWTDIRRTSAKHGHFAGQSDREADAYFAFFAGPDTPLRQRAARALSRAWRLLPHQTTQGPWRKTPSRLAYLRSDDRP